MEGELRNREGISILSQDECERNEMQIYPKAEKEEEGITHPTGRFKKQKVPHLSLSSQNLIEEIICRKCLKMCSTSV